MSDESGGPGRERAPTSGDRRRRDGDRRHPIDDPSDSDGDRNPSSADGGRSSGAVAGALAYPVRGAAAERPLVVCWILLLLSGIVPLAPLVPLLGYLLAVLDASERDAPAPDFLADAPLRAVLTHVRRGLGALALALAVLGAPVAALLITVYGASTRTGGAPTSFRSGVAFYAGSTVVLATALAAAYLLPLLWLRYAQTDRLRAVADASWLRREASRAGYFTGWVTGASIGAFGLALATRLAGVGRAGAVVGALGVAYVSLVACHLWGRSIVAGAN